VSFAAAPSAAILVKMQFRGVGSNLPLHVNLLHELRKLRLALIAYLRCHKLENVPSLPSRNVRPVDNCDDPVRPTDAGLDQLNLLLPPSLAGTGFASVSVSMGGKTSNTVLVTIR
jgi:hypothetical protein